MEKDQIIGWLLCIGSIIGIGLYFLLVFMFAPTLTLQITAFLAVAAMLGILAWIGWTMGTTPPPAPIEPEPATPPVEGPSPASEAEKKE